MAHGFGRRWGSGALWAALLAFVLLWQRAAHAEDAHRFRAATPERGAQVQAALTDGVDDDTSDPSLTAPPRTAPDGAPKRFQRRGMGGLPLGGFSPSWILMLAYAYFAFRDSRGGTGRAGWGSYYLFWLVGPILLSLFLDYPALLGLIVVGVVARPWLPDPFLWLRYYKRTRVLQGEIRVNRANVTARRDLALMWLDKRSPKRALPLVEEALVQDPSSLQLQQLKGVCLLGLHRYDDAVACFIQVVQKDPSHGFGEPYLRAADALIALQRWDDAEDALEHFIANNRSSVEGQYKLALVARGKGERAATKEALRAARSLYREVPRYQQRRQFGWYARALLASLRF